MASKNPFSSDYEPPSKADEKDKERNRFSARMARKARIGVNLTGAATKFSLERLASSKPSSATAKAFATALGKTKGPLMKIAQILSTIPELVPDEFAEELAKLQAHAPSMGWPFVKRRMTSELGSDWEDNFAEFGKKAAHAASLGQVHAAILHDGRRVAVKLQYPEMASAVESDVSQMAGMVGLYKRVDKALDPDELVHEIGDRLREELDYIREAKHMRLYADMLRDRADIHIPEPIESLSTKRLLTMTWLEGEGLTHFEGTDQETRNQIAERLHHAFWFPMIKYGVIHGDPHLGNYSLTPGAEAMNLLDFGCVRIFSPRFVDGVVELYRALLEDNDEAIMAAYTLWGFENITLELSKALSIWARFIYGPLLDDRIRTIADGVKPGEFGRSQALEARKALARIGRVKVPREFVFMDRAAVGLGAAFLRLDAKLNFYELFNQSLEGHSVEALTKRQSLALNKSELELPGK